MELAMVIEHGFYGISKEGILFNMKKLDKIMGMDKYSLEICLIGGTACILTGLINRATIDYDMLNLNYTPRVRNYLNFFQPYDLVDFEATTIPRSYNERTKPVFKGDYLSCSILAVEDIIVSKLCRNIEKDFGDIDVLIKNADIKLVRDLINEVSSDIKTRYPRIQENFRNSRVTFGKRYNIDV
jgi:hypothetical protein